MINLKKIREPGYLLEAYVILLSKQYSNDDTHI